ncbi:hypothetical protein BBJ28_00003523 [Nothophytophthora sp. Chile5]|nr:hypothetical protein BBJ28_00003523 [Nothophytophthora sp. Chile5]
MAAALRVGSVRDLKGLREVKISKSVLATLQVIRQVDRKFILAKASTPRGSLLLCIDQHAADERVRLESLEAAVFGPDGSQRNVDFHEHEPPLILLMNAKERETLWGNEDLVRSWGFDFECVSCHSESSFLSDPNTPEQNREGHVLLHSTPKVEKRIANADDFREFLRHIACTGGYSGYSYIRPPVITRLLHSRACRSAIMFGDWLSVGQCKALVEELKTCQLPFQCAHGRPSVVPLAELNASCGSTSSDDIV